MSFLEKSQQAIEAVKKVANGIKKTLRKIMGALKFFASGIVKKLFWGMAKR